MVWASGMFSAGLAGTTAMFIGRAHLTGILLEEEEDLEFL